MNFFQAQKNARKASRTLVLLFILAVIVITVAITAAIYLVFGQHQDGQGLFSAVALSDHFNLIGASGLLTIIFISGASAFRVATLRNGGGQIARDLGGDRVNEDTRDPQLRRLLNVVEEIAIASGVPVPEIYVLEQESAINMLAAGHSLNDAAIVVTRGALDNLDRNELQGVIAHEFSHILNGDMRLNIQLLGMVFGITALSLIGRRVLYHTRWVGGNRRGAGGIVLVALALVVIGALGLFFARLIKAAISRQRETLADASAVQFTRDPQGIAGALKKIAAMQGAAVLSTDTEEVDHMLFASGRVSRLFATHPPLLERIKAVDPGFQAGELKRIAANLSKQRAAAETQKMAAEDTRPGRDPSDPRNILEGIGQPHWQQILYASVLAQAIPDQLNFAAHSAQRSPALVYYLLLSTDQEKREQQLLELSRRHSDVIEHQTRAFYQMWGVCKDEQQLPLLEMAMPALKRRPRRDLIDMLDTIESIAPKEGNEAVFPFLMSRVLRLYLEESLDTRVRQPKAKYKLAQCTSECALVLALIASYEGNLSSGEIAYQAGYQRLDLGTPPAYNPPAVWSETLTQALRKLDQLTPEHKEKFVEALIAVGFNDRRMNVRELELVRAVCATLHVPLPPIKAATSESE
ncbi:MAG: M48 family metallopeptidase [Wenzhouxiangellaceae bacterium]